LFKENIILQEDEVITSIHCSLQKNGRITPIDLDENKDKKSKEPKKIDQQEIIDVEELIPSREL